MKLYNRNCPTDIESKLQELISEGVRITDEEERFNLNAYEAFRHLASDKWIKIDSDYYTIETFTEEFLTNQ